MGTFSPNMMLVNHPDAGGTEVTMPPASHCGEKFNRQPAGHCRSLSLFLFFYSFYLIGLWSFDAQYFKV